MSNSIKYIEIKKSYSENKKHNWKNTSIDNYVKMIKDKNVTSSIFEIFNSDKPVKIYFDIEKIPTETPDLINEIIGDLRLWFANTTKLELGDYILTLNESSESHPGLSYHLIFYQWFTLEYNILCMLNEFLGEHPQYVKFMDGSVYTDGRLFKSINQIGINKNKISKNENNYHKIINCEQTDETIKQSIIQYIENSTELKYQFKEVDRPKYKQISRGGRIKIDKPNIVIHNHIEKDDKTENGVFKQLQNIDINDQIYSLMYALNMSKKLNKAQKKYIKELMKYYEKHKTYKGFRQNEIQILSILKFIHGN